MEAIKRIININQTIKQKRGTIMDFRKVYNMEQANFYVMAGLAKDIIATGVTCGKAWVKFKDSVELQKMFKLWCEK
ncbi:hypothetical protein [Clostridium scatologenes]|uniref:Uncharacterized protein n=1 Tax=Clostridium scatologenes TaxID=1548 RepID=A0A0E3JQT8_CLOSL|nr:hypothetical protein [Clostridium scatologenes]AKA71223.1 hypothetical protein CSCA_4098 [Clostridium scatologenes]